MFSTSSTPELGSAAGAVLSNWWSVLGSDHVAAYIRYPQLLKHDTHRGSLSGYCPYTPVGASRVQPRDHFIAAGVTVGGAWHCEVPLSFARRGDGH